MIFYWYIFKWSIAKEYDHPPYSSDQMIRNLVAAVRWLVILFGSGPFENVPIKNDTNWPPNHLLIVPIKTYQLSAYVMA